ncbi:MAG: GtrA family protein, partial [Myxococcota bacterium]
MERTSILVQFGWYLLVGGASTVIDLGGFWLGSQAGLPFLVASPLSFLAGTACNYVLSQWLAFRSGRRPRGAEVAAFGLVVGVGLVLNSGVAWLFVSAGVAGVLAKALAIPFVLGWNFFGRRWLVFRPELPDATWDLTRR